MRCGSFDYEAKPYRVRWIKRDGSSKERAYATEADARNAFDAPFGAGVNRAVLERMVNDKKKWGVKCWYGIRMVQRGVK